MTTMDTDHQHLVARLQRVAAGYGYRILPGAPIVTFYNPGADCWLRTRNASLYRKLAEWQERPFDARAVVPRRPT